MCPPRRNRSYTATREERARDAQIWKLSLNSAGSNGPMNQRPDSAEAVGTKVRLHKEAGSIPVSKLDRNITTHSQNRRTVT